MTVITVGPGAIMRAGSQYIDSSLTALDTHSPANATGKLNTAEFYASSSGTGLKVGTFYGSALSWTYRAQAALGNLAGGSKQTFTGLSFDVSLNDILGIHIDGGVVNLYSSGSGGCLGKTGDHFTAEGAQTYVDLGGYTTSIYASGSGSDVVGKTNKFISIGDRRIKRHRSFFRKNLKLK